MICEKQTKRYCCEDITMIENYEQAINDTTQTWECHHRDEVKILPSGMTVIRSIQDLKDNGRYYGCPANELIFLTASEHSRLHSKYRTAENHPMYGKKFSTEAIAKMAAGKKGKPLSVEHRKKLSEVQKGKKRGPYKKHHGQ